MAGCVVHQAVVGGVQVVGEHAGGVLQHGMAGGRCDADAEDVTGAEAAVAGGDFDIDRAHVFAQRAHIEAAVGSIKNQPRRQLKACARCCGVGQRVTIHVGKGVAGKGEGFALGRLHGLVNEGSDQDRCVVDGVDGDALVDVDVGFAVGDLVAQGHGAVVVGRGREGVADNRVIDAVGHEGGVGHLQAIDAEYVRNVCIAKALQQLGHGDGNGAVFVDGAEAVGGACQGRCAVRVHRVEDHHSGAAHGLGLALEVGVADLNTHALADQVVAGCEVA